MRNLIHKKLSYTARVLVAAILILASVLVQAKSFYVSKSGNNNGGSSWDEAWTEFNRVNWNTVGSGSTLYVAASTYVTCFPTVSIPGITIKRATVSDHAQMKDGKTPLMVRLR